MAKREFKDTYIPQDRDLCVRRVREDRYEVSEWRGDLADGGWHDEKTVGLAELNKFVRIHEFLGTHREWEYYRPIGKMQAR